MESISWYNEKLKKSIQHYRENVNEYKKNRSKTICLHEYKKNEKIENIKVCKAKKKNGGICPSILKKNSEFCHRHFQIFIIENEIKKLNEPTKNDLVKI